MADMTVRLQTDKIERLQRRALAHADAGEEEVLIKHSTLASLCAEVLEARKRGLRAVRRRVPTTDAPDVEDEATALAHGSVVTEPTDGDSRPNNV